jgi:hypothetical protein
MPRVVVLVQRPYHLSSGEARDWLRRELDALDVEELERAELTPLTSVSLRWTGSWDWLVELHCSSADHARRLLDGDAFSALLGDLRLLGMRPAVTVAVEEPQGQT